MLIVNPPSTHSCWLFETWPSSHPGWVLLCAYFFILTVMFLLIKDLGRSAPALIFFIYPCHALFFLWKGFLSWDFLRQGFSRWDDKCFGNNTQSIKWHRKFTATLLQNKKSRVMVVGFLCAIQQNIYQGRSFRFLRFYFCCSTLCDFHFWKC